MLEKENVMAVTVPHSQPVSAKRQGELALLPRKSYAVMLGVFEISSDGRTQKSTGKKSLIENRPAQLTIN